MFSWFYSLKTTMPVYPRRRLLILAMERALFESFLDHKNLSEESYRDSSVDTVSSGGMDFELPVLPEERPNDIRMDLPQRALLNYPTRP